MLSMGNPQAMVYVLVEKFVDNIKRHGMIGDGSYLNPV